MSASTQYFCPICYKKPDGEKRARHAMGHCGSLGIDITKKNEFAFRFEILGMILQHWAGDCSFNGHVRTLNMDRLGIMNSAKNPFTGLKEFVITRYRDDEEQRMPFADGAADPAPFESMPEGKTGYKIRKGDRVVFLVIPNNKCAVLDTASHMNFGSKIEQSAPPVIAARAELISYFNWSEENVAKGIIMTCHNSDEAFMKADLMTGSATHNLEVHDAVFRRDATIPERPGGYVKRSEAPAKIVPKKRTPAEDLANALKFISNDNVAVAREMIIAFVSVLPEDHPLHDLKELVRVIETDAAIIPVTQAYINKYAKRV